MATRIQRQLDHDRRTYLVAFPRELSEEQVLSWLTSIGGTLKMGRGRIVATPTIAFEMWATDRGISHRLKVPWQEADYVIGQLRSLVPGISITPEKERPVLSWNQVHELGMSDPARTIANALKAKDASTSILASIQALEPGEAVMLQWVVTPALREALPEKNNHKNKSSVFDVLLGATTASGDEIDDRRKKLEQPNLLAIGRVGATASTEARAAHLVQRVERALSSLQTAANGFTRVRKLSGAATERIQLASSPYLFPAQFSLSELLRVIAWPIGQPFVAGLPQGATRHLFAGEDIPREGLVVGHSNFPGHERPIAVSFTRACEHMYFGGTTGSGKSTEMGNTFAQAVTNGNGAVVIDASSSESHESLFFRALNLIPKDRIKDCIIIDVNRDRMHPVGFNVLDQGTARQVVDQITELIGHLYKDTSGIWMRELLFHGLYTLAEHGGYTLLDLPKLIQPKTPEEAAWADQLIREVKDPELKDFWVRWDNYSTRDRAAHVEPLLNRIWQLTARSEIRNIIGQTKSSFQWDDVLRENKIVLISLVGLPKDTASILGTLFVNALWTSAQSMVPEKENYLFLDEFQLVTRLPMGLEDMLRLARKHRLGAVLGTQYIDDLTPDMKMAIINAVRTRVIFSTSSREARLWQSEFGRQLIDEYDLVNLGRFEAVAQVSTDTGISRPVTIKALAPLSPTGTAKAVLEESRKTYGRTLDEVEAEMLARRMAAPTSKKKRPTIGVKGWDEK